MTYESNEALLSDGECSHPNCIEPGEHTGPHSGDPTPTLADRLEALLAAVKDEALVDSILQGRITRTHVCLVLTHTVAALREREARERHKRYGHTDAAGDFPYAGCEIEKTLAALDAAKKALEEGMER